MKFPLSLRKLSFIRNRKVSVLLVLVFVASALLIFINYYTIKTTSAVRAYINGESEYSKGQKDALLYLTTYIQTENIEYWQKFKASIDVPIGDNVARKEMTSNGEHTAIKKGFIRGNNNPDDLEEMIWLFKNFRSVSFMKQAIKIWKDAEILINELESIGDEADSKIKTHTLTIERKQQLVKQINDVTSKLTVMEHAFSNVLGNAARTINEYLFIANIIFTILIVGSVSMYSIHMVKKLIESEQVLIERNEDLTNANHELDNFVHIVSHDMRAPMASLKGLIQVSYEEESKENTHKYLHMMEEILKRQDHFIREIIEYSRNKLTSVNLSKINLKEIIHDVVEQNKYSPEARKIKIIQRIDVDSIYGDALRLKIILNNIISNAIKYHSQKKDEKVIIITASKRGKNYEISVQDNGIGISKENQERIFDIFFKTNHSNKSTGLGLYITREAIHKLGGTIHVDSEENIGTTFTVSIPYHSKNLNTSFNAADVQ